MGLITPFIAGRGPPCKWQFQELFYLHTCLRKSSKLKFDKYFSKWVDKIVIFATIAIQTNSPSNQYGIILLNFRICSTFVIVSNHFYRRNLQQISERTSKPSSAWWIKKLKTTSGLMMGLPRSQEANDHQYIYTQYMGTTVTRMMKCGSETSPCMFLFDLYAF